MNGKDPQTYAIIGAAMEVHGHLGNGFLEAVYQDALEIEFIARGIQFFRECDIPVFYKGKPLGAPYHADFLCYEEIIVELKAIKALTGVEDAQVIHYLKAIGFNRALLFNFGAPRLEYKRFANSLRLNKETGDERVQPQTSPIGADPKINLRTSA